LLESLTVCSRLEFVLVNADQSSHSSSDAVGFLERLPRHPLCRVPRRWLPSGAGRARGRMLHPGRVEGRAPASLVIASELMVEALVGHAKQNLSSPESELRPGCHSACTQQGERAQSDEGSSNIFIVLQPRAVGCRPHAEGDRGTARHARSPAIMPVRKTPSKVPAPPMETTGAANSLIRSRFRRSAPIKVPIEPE